MKGKGHKELKWYKVYHKNGNIKDFLEIVEIVIFNSSLRLNISSSIKWIFSYI